MVFTSKEMVVLATSPGDTFRLCVTDEGGFLGRAYDAADVERLRQECGASTVRWAPGGKNFPGGENTDAVVRDLNLDLVASDTRLAALKAVGGSEYVAELEHHVEVCAELVRRLERLAHTEP